MQELSREQQSILNAELNNRGVERPMDLNAAIQLVSDVKNPEIDEGKRDQAKTLLEAHLGEAATECALYLGISELLTDVVEGRINGDNLFSLFDDRAPEKRERATWIETFKRLAKYYERDSSIRLQRIELEAIQFNLSRKEAFYDLLDNGSLVLDDEQLEAHSKSCKENIEGARETLSRVRDQLKNELRGEEEEDLEGKLEESKIERRKFREKSKFPSLGEFIDLMREVSNKC